ncbi:hypothetical protein K438DRAFT_1987072 [Mycena galopus ATCC 62051]|nr:hypothetical protein K438DRAFT_1987072 [Mycena galopus ATCC 62051]
MAGVSVLRAQRKSFPVVGDARDALFSPNFPAGRSPARLLTMKLHARPPGKPADPFRLKLGARRFPEDRSTPNAHFDPGFQRFLRQRQEDEAWAAYLSNNTAPSTHAQTAQEAHTVHAPEPIRPAQVTQPYHSARALPTPQNQALVAPSAYAPFIGAATLAPSAMTLSTSHVNQARLASARTTLPRRITQRNAGRPLGSTNRRGPSIAALPGPRVDSCFAPGLNGD